MTKTNGSGEVARRSILTAIGGGALASFAAGRAQGANAWGDYSGAEQRNIELVTNFCTDWSTLDVEKLVPYLSDTLEYHVWEGGMVVNGVDAFRTNMGAMLGRAQSITWEINRSSAIGDIVVNERWDHMLYGGDGSKDRHFNIVGVFLVRDNKIQYWKDYTAPKA